LTVSVVAIGGCTITGGTITMTNGTTDCTLTASQAGDSNYTATTDVVRMVSPAKASQTITFAQLASPQTLGATFTVSASSTSSLAVMIVASGGCSISSGTVTMTSGTTDCTLTASQAGDANYSAAADVVRTVSPAKASQTITFAQPTSPVAYASTFTVSATSTSGLTVTIVASGGCSITAGTVTMTSGTTDCTLTASQAGDANYVAGADVVRTVSATKATQTITFAQPSSPQTNGATFSVSATATSNLTVTIVASGDCSILSGTVTMTSGTTDCALTASQAGDANYSAATSVVRTVSAQKAAQTITFAQPTSPQINGVTFSFGATSTSGLGVSVTAAGGCSTLGSTVTTSGTTNCTLTASQAGDANYTAATDVVRVISASCTSSVGPGISPPARVPSGVPGFHAAWYGQSGYMTLCPGETAVATVAIYNSGSFDWVSGVMGQHGRQYARRFARSSLPPRRREVMWSTTCVGSAAAPLVAGAGRLFREHPRAERSPARAVALRGRAAPVRRGDPMQRTGSEARAPWLRARSSRSVRHSPRPHSEADHPRQRRVPRAGREEDRALGRSAVIYAVRAALMCSRIGAKSMREPHHGCASRWASTAAAAPCAPSLR